VQVRGSTEDRPAKKLPFGLKFLPSRDDVSCTGATRFRSPCFSGSSLRTKLLWIGADLAVTDPHVRGALPAVEILAESSLAGGLARLRTTDFVAIVLSLAALPCSGDQALEDVQRIAPDARVIVHHREGAIDDVITLTRRGAFYVLLGELEPGALAEAVAKASRSSRARLQATPESARWRQYLIGQSRGMLQICEIIELVAAKRCTILITGETGTGKEVVAKAIHAASNRAAASLVSVNCTALPATLIETELFGHAKGAFTGAHSSRIGRFEQAHRGSIFLDEIGDLPLEAQAKLLRVLQEQEFQRVGSSETVRVDVRVIAASNVDLEQAARERRFREDLYYRLNVVPVHLPPLRDRRADIPLLLEHFLDKIRRLENAAPKQIGEEAVQYLEQLDWPGNVRQLEHAVQMAFAMSGDRPVLVPSDFRARKPARVEPGARAETGLARVTPEGLDFDEVVSGVELSLLNQALTLSGGNKARAADLLKIKRTTLLAKMKSLAERSGVPEVPDSAAPFRRPPSSERAAPTVLLLDIEPPIRQLISRTLEQQGFRLLYAASASEALELVDCWRQQIRLLIAPAEPRGQKTGGGLEMENFTASCRRCAPDMGFLLVSSLSHAESASNRPRAEIRTEILSCPFSSSCLLEAVRMLSMPSGAPLAEERQEACA
jgi:DNA-binding NtrC family response regulator